MKRRILLFFVSLLYLIVLFTFPSNAQTVFSWPVHGGILTSHYSYWHKGIDLAVPTGSPVYAAKSGWVRYARWDTSGYGFRIDLDDQIDQTRYAHLSAIWVIPGQWVYQGQQIGLSGSTGRSTGPHLHFEVSWLGTPIDPLLPLP